MKIGIFGGTFDPPHLGHELFVRIFLREYKPDRMFAVPTRIPPHKACESTSPRCRLEMARLAFKGLAEVSDCELKRRGKSFTSDTLSYFAKRFPGAELYFIIGSDMLFTFDEWHEPEKILSLATVVAAPRENGAVGEMEKKAKSLTERFGGRIEILPLTPREISSTAIREKHLPEVSEAVAKYIAENGLYCESDEIRRLKKIISARLSQKRYFHSLGVMNTAAELGRIYGADPERLAVAGLVHDCTKEITEKEHQKLIEKYGLTVPPDERGIEKLLHSLTGAAFAEHELGITDSEVLSAIACHTAGKAGMTLFEKILFVADFIDPSRDYRGVDAIRKTAARDIDRAVLVCSAFSIKDLAARGKPIAINTVMTYNEAARAVFGSHKGKEKQK